MIREIIQVNSTKFPKSYRTSIILRPNTDWYSDELRSAKTERRKAEREMQKYS
jgi:nicotinamide riboside kinase